MAQFQTVRFLTGLSAALCLVVPVQSDGAIKTPPPSAGFYDSVKVDRETGDDDGLRLELRYVAATPKITFWWCEGECIARRVRDLSIKAGKISFIADEVTVLPGGKSATYPRRFTGAFGPAGLSLESAGFWKTERLKFRHRE
jgi:hypothetical protein